MARRLAMTDRKVMSSAPISARSQSRDRRSAATRLHCRRQPFPTDDQLRLRLAEELEYARRMLSSMGDELSSDGLIVSRHLAELQTIDIVGQMIGHIAAVVRSSDPPGAVEAIGMGALKARLMRRSVL